jgi:hypothetical protein
MDFSILKAFTYQNSNVNMMFLKFLATVLIFIIIEYIINILYRGVFYPQYDLLVSNTTERAVFCNRISARFL